MNFDFEHPNAIDLQRERFALGDVQRAQIRDVMRHLDGSNYDLEAMNSSLKLEAGRKAVWAAEYEALRRDPRDRFWPPERT